MPCIFDGIHDVAYIDLIFPNRIPAYIHVSWLDPCKVRRVTVVGSKKMIVYNDLENEQKLKIYDKGVETPAYTNGGFNEFQCNYRFGDIVSRKFKWLSLCERNVSISWTVLSTMNNPGVVEMMV